MIAKEFERIERAYRLRGEQDALAVLAELRALADEVDDVRCIHCVIPCGHEACGDRSKCPTCVAKTRARRLLGR